MLRMESLSQEANHDAGEGNKGTSHLRWTTEMDRVLIDTFMKELTLGNKGDNGWKPCAYAQVRKNMRKRLGVTLMSHHIRNRLKTWKCHCVAINKCLEHSEFRWDEVSMTLTAPDSVWASYLKENPKADGYRMKCIPNFKDICRITGHEQIIDTFTRTGPENVAGEKGEEGSQIGGGIEDLPEEEDHLANGRELGYLTIAKHTQQPTSSSSVPTTRQGVPAKRKRESNSGVGMVGTNGQELGNLTVAKHTQQPTSSSSVPTTRRSVPAKRKRESNSEVCMVDVMGSLAEGIQRIASAMEDKKPVDLSSLVQELSKIPDFSDELVIQASEFLAYDDRWARLFFALSGDQRKSWLLRRLGR